MQGIKGIARQHSGKITNAIQLFQVTQHDAGNIRELSLSNMISLLAKRFSRIDGIVHQSVQNNKLFTSYSMPILMSLIRNYVITRKRRRYGQGSDTNQLSGLTLNIFLTSKQLGSHPYGIHRLRVHSWHSSRHTNHRTKASHGFLTKIPDSKVVCVDILKFTIQTGILKQYTQMSVNFLFFRSERFQIPSELYKIPVGVGPLAIWVGILYRRLLKLEYFAMYKVSNCALLCLQACV